MRRQLLSRTELNLSTICYGTGNFGTLLAESEAFQTLDAFTDGGGNFIDTANVYCKWVKGLGNSSEQYLGRWLKSRNAYNRVVIATKGGHYDFAEPDVSRVTRTGIGEDLEESLKSLGVSHIDFYWLHRDNLKLPIEEIIDIMEGFVRDGKIRYYGASNYSQQRMEQAWQYANRKKIQGFSAVSNQWSLATVNPGSNLNSDPSLVMMDPSYYKWHRQSNMPMIPYSSGAYGYFSKLHQGRTLSEAIEKAYSNEKNHKIYKDLCQYSAKHGISVHALSLAWLCNQPFQVFPVVSASAAEQMEDILTAGELELKMSFIETYIP